MVLIWNLILIVGFIKMNRFLVNCIDKILSLKRNDINIYVTLLKKYSKNPVKKVLELGCGAGSFLIPFCKKIKCIEGVGLDLNNDFIEHCNKKYLSTNYKFELKLFNMDMRYFKLDTYFDLVLAPYSSLQEAETVNDIELIFANVSNYLNPNGIFIFDLILAEDFYAPKPIITDVIFLTPINCNTELFFKKRTYFNKKKKKLKANYQFLEMDNSGKHLNFADFDFYQTFFYFKEFKSILKKNNIKILEVYKNKISSRSFIITKKT